MMASLPESLPDSKGIFLENVMNGAMPASHGLGPSQENQSADSSPPAKAKTTSQRRRPPPKTKPKPKHDSQEQKKSTGPKNETKKRTRKAPKKPPAQPVTKDAPDGGDYDPKLEEIDDSPADPSQRNRALERNRVAATRCRNRKRGEVSTLASCEQEMEDRNRYLSATYDALRTEAYFLKTKLLQHNECNCVLIQRYIANEAKKSVDRLTGVGGPEAGSSASGVGGYGEGTPSSTPDLQGSSCPSTAPESIQTRSPMTGIPGEGTQQQWADGFAGSGGKSNTMPAHMVGGYQQVPTMVPYTHIQPEFPVNAYNPQQMIGMNEAQYMQTPSANNMMWNTGWQMG